MGKSILRNFKNQRPFGDRISEKLPARAWGSSHWTLTARAESGKPCTGAHVCGDLIALSAAVSNSRHACVRALRDKEQYERETSELQITMSPCVTVAVCRRYMSTWIGG